MIVYFYIIILGTWTYIPPYCARSAIHKLNILLFQDAMEEWAICQKSWLYLEPIFSSDDIMRQLPVEGKRYQTMDRMWRKVMLAAKQDPKVSRLIIIWGSVL